MNKTYPNKKETLLNSNKGGSKTNMDTDTKDKMLNSINIKDPMDVDSQKRKTASTPERKKQSIIKSPEKRSTRATTNQKSLLIWKQTRKRRIILYASLSATLHLLWPKSALLQLPGRLGRWLQVTNSSYRRQKKQKENSKMKWKKERTATRRSFHS